MSSNLSSGTTSSYKFGSASGGPAALSPFGRWFWSAEPKQVMTLWLDDDQVHRKPWMHGYIGAEWAKTADEAITLLETGRFDFASLDHDLSWKAAAGMPEPNEKTGDTVICWLEQHPEYWPMNGVRVHSFNVVGKEKMLTVIRAHYGKDFQ